MKNIRSILLTGVLALGGYTTVSAQTPEDADYNQQAEIDSLQQRLDAIEEQTKAYQAQLDADSKKALQKKIWGKGRYTRLGYAIAQTAAENEPVYDGKYGFFLTKGTTYRIPSKPIAGLLKFGIDVTWFDLQVSKYDNPAYSVEGGWTSEIDKTVGSYDDEDNEDFDLNIGYLGVGVGMGIGPSVSVAPFALGSSKGLMPLRATLYFHYAPSYMFYIASQDGDVELSTAFCNQFNFGGNISYRWIAVGVEGRWGSGSFKPMEFDEELGMGSEKYKRKFANTRFYVQFTF
ncbi:MAG: hypothetical protein NC328_08685 [Muribaculum sp.]|nr:hypothetical protein [Muribaculum sp.]